MEAANLLRRPVESTGESSLPWLTASGRQSPRMSSSYCPISAGAQRQPWVDFSQLDTSVLIKSNVDGGAILYSYVPWFYS